MAMNPIIPLSVRGAACARVSVRLLARQALMVLAIVALAATRAYPQSLELLPQYKPEQKGSGVIRTFGIPMIGMGETWAGGFRRYPSDVHFEHTDSNAAGIAGLFTKVADIDTSGREPALTEYFSFYETFHYLPLEITVATGAYDVKGGSYGLVVYVN